MKRFVVETLPASVMTDMRYFLKDQLTGIIQATFADSGDAEQFARTLEMSSKPVPDLMLRVLLRAYGEVLDSGDSGGYGSADCPIYQQVSEYLNQTQAADEH